MKDQEVTLTATVTAGVAGSVQFYDGATALGSPIPVSTGTAKYSTEALPVGTADALTATFTPTNSIYAVSTSAVVDEKITNPTATATHCSTNSSCFSVHGNSISFDNFIWSVDNVVCVITQLVRKPP